MGVDTLEWLFGLVLIVGLSLLLWMRWEAVSYRISYNHIELKRLPRNFNGMNILFITDIHRRKLSHKRFDSLKGKVDLILLGGDLMQRKVPLLRVRYNMNILRAIAPVYAVHGNHDYDAGVRKLDLMLKECGVILLNNEQVVWEKDGESLCLTGIDEHRKKDTTERLLNTKADCHIVLVHDPKWIQEMDTVSVDLILAGHTHGGQIRLPFIGAIHLGPFYKKYANGLFQLDSSIASPRAKMFISRGIGTNHLPLRLACRAEVHIIVLHGAQS
ncbi:metallophosphoesterase [Paenibacillus sediminis]|uniref:MPP superfamily phosphohydrolase n=1 Tax=Paenibacillus sediminis TaxID=664909 RepID=A0ABS4GZM9_9BACL|nr:metallophosphoesterase [Paenibacillus sediminis]MBP1935731.1 putative MPP superfamily phosphohydrolase [Paenibacillus sediminis]